MTEEANASAAARYVEGATILLGNGTYFDCANPEATPWTIEDYAYALAYTVRFRGQTKVDGQRVFYGVCEHNVRGAEHLLREGYGKEHALAFLFHESGEAPFGDLPGPAKSLFANWREHEHRCCVAINAHFGIVTPDPVLIKRFDLRMYATERRDLMPGTPPPPAEGYEPFEPRIIPFRHPDQAAERFLNLYTVLSR